jgi:hypothetical protein
MSRTLLALGSYWALFIIMPLVLCFLLLGVRAAGWCLPLFLVWCLVGERGFRGWKRLWGIE